MGTAHAAHTGWEPLLSILAWSPNSAGNLSIKAGKLPATHLPHPRLAPESRVAGKTQGPPDC